MIERIMNEADVYAQGGEHGNALRVALIRGYQEIVTLLLDKSRVLATV